MADTAESAVRIRGLNVERGGNPVLRSVDADVRTGEVTALLGPSGCGKTTLMRAIVGVQIVHGGSVTVLGLPAGSPQLRTRVGYQTQAPSVYFDLTVRENLRYFASVLGAGAHEVESAIETVGLTRYGDAEAGRLSGGEKARVSLAAALLNRPRLLVLDEPTVGVDPVLRRDLWQTFRSLAAAGTALLVSSHVMDEAARCDRLLLMRDGAILAACTPHELRRDTGTDDLEEAFLRLIDRSEGAPSAAG
jgi:ABC-2 type transport system ATP-binding protein